jgi:WD40 repeat protein
LPHQRRALFRHSVCLFGSFVVIGAIGQHAPEVVWRENTHNSFVAPVAISPDGSLVASAGTNNSIRLANLADGSAVRRLAGHTDGVASIAFSPDGKLLASTADDRTLRLWDVAGGTLMRTVFQGGGNRQFTAVAFHPDGQHVAADRNRTNVVLWKVSGGTAVWETFGNAWQIESIAFSPDGSVVAAAGGYRGLDVKIRVIRALDGLLLHSLSTSNSYGVRQLAFSPNGQWLVAGCYESTAPGGVEVWRVSDWTQHRGLAVTAPSVAFSPDGRLLVTLRANVLDLWSVPGGTLLRSFGIPESGLYGRHLSVAVSPQGDRIVTGNYKNIATTNGTVTESAATAIRFPIVLSIDLQNSSLATLNWSGGYPRYQVQRRLFDTSVWLNFGDTTTNRSIILPLDGPGAMFRVIGAAQ